MSEDIKQETQQPKQATSLSLNDLRAFQHIIDVCSTRGAFKAEELTSIGIIYDRLTAFLAATDAVTMPLKPDNSEKEKKE